MLAEFQDGSCIAVLCSCFVGFICDVCFPHITTRVGNFIIGAGGSDKQMLCASIGARAALNIAAEKSKQKR